MLRAIALWNRDKRVVIPLILLHLGQWGLYLHNVFIFKEKWEGASPFNTQQGCVFVTVTWPWLKVRTLVETARYGN